MTRNSVKKWFIRTKIFLKRYFVNLLIFMQVAICYLRKVCRHLLNCYHSVFKKLKKNNKYFHMLTNSKSKLCHNLRTTQETLQWIP